MRALGDDRGAVAVIAAILLGGGVLLGMAGLVIGTGIRAVTQQQLQDGADAAALAVARSCALGSCDPGLAQRYAQAGDPAGQVAAVCGSGIAATCPAGCPPPGRRRWADVETTSPPSTPFPGFTLPPGFFCAQASWLRGFPVTFLTG